MNHGSPIQTQYTGEGTEAHRVIDRKCPDCGGP
jgi:hypothetical protein